MKGYGLVFAKLIRSGGINAIARQLGESPSATLSLARLLMPGLLEGLRNFPGGMAELLEMFADAGGVDLAAAIMRSEPVDTSPGQAIIARIGGIVLSPLDDTPANTELRLRVAPLLAMLVVGYVSARATASTITNTELESLLADKVEKAASSDEESV